MTMISRVSFASIPVLDLDRALAFWRDVMGLAVTVDSSALPGMRWVMLRPGAAETQIHLEPVSAMPEGRRPALPLIAADVPATIETLRARGVAVVAEPKPAEWDPATIYAIIRDSEGNLILIASQ